MPKLVALDEYISPHPPELVYRTVGDLESYPDWWPASLAVSVLSPLPTRIGTRLQLSNGWFVRWIATVVELRPMTHVVLRYSNGAWMGTTVWTLTAVPGGTRVVYEIDVEIVPLWLRLVSVAIDFRKIHSNEMRRVFAALDRHLSTLV